MVPKDVTSWDPPITDDTPDGFGNKLRQRRLVDLCERGWERLAIECFAKPSTNVTTCIGMLSPERRVEIKSTIAEVNELHRKILSAIKTPASYTCDKVAIAHYTDAKWKAELPKQTGVARTRSITKARKRLVEECKTALWSEGTRACLTTVGHRDCYTVEPISRYTWRVPKPMTKPAPSGITECDDYVNAVWALESCAAFPKESLDMMKAMTDEAMYEWQAIHPDHLVYLREGCKAGGGMVRDVKPRERC